jgi:hypothetical protein
MPRPHYVAVSDSETEIVEELTTHETTKRGTKLKQKRVVEKGPVQPKKRTTTDAKASGSRRKIIPDAQALHNEDIVENTDNNYMVQTYELVADPEYEADEILEDVDPQRNVCLLRAFKLHF